MTQDQKPPKKRPSDAAVGGRVATVVLLGLVVFVTLLVVFAG